MRESAAESNMVPRALRFIFCDRRRSMWFLHAKLPRTLPEAVNRNRFLALALVLILGISFSSFDRGHSRPLARSDERLGMPTPDRSQGP